MPVLHSLPWVTALMEGMDGRRRGPRHGHATHLLVANTHPKVVQERLGHANIQLTLDTYSHVLPSMQEDAATTIDAAMRAALKRR